jgi:hypothetical protein
MGYSEAQGAFWVFVIFMYCWVAGVVGVLTWHLGPRAHERPPFSTSKPARGTVFTALFGALVWPLGIPVILGMTWAMHRVREFEAEKVKV